MTERSKKRSQLKRFALHSIRVLLLLTILLLIRWQAAEGRVEQGMAASLLDEAIIETVFEDCEVAQTLNADASQSVLDSEGQVVGYVLQTSPVADEILGFSGPTNVLLAFDVNDSVVGVRILASGDTREHVRQVEEDSEFLTSFVGLTRAELANQQLDGVAGATLTSMAIRESIALRVTGSRASLRFTDLPDVGAVQKVLPGAVSLQSNRMNPSWVEIQASDGGLLGFLLRSSPQADNIIGYQGPTELGLIVSPEEQVLGLIVGRSYDNEPYVTYVRDEKYFLKYFNGRSLAEFSETTVEEEGIEGVSGATMTSMAAVEGMMLAASDHVARLKQQQSRSRSRQIAWSWRDIGSGVVILIGLVIGLTHLRGRKGLRLVFQAVLIGYLGLVNGDMLSQAMLVGWAQSGVPWQHAGGLVLLTCAALIVPIVTRHNVYCSHLCPHGAVQQIVKNRLPWKLKLSRRVSRVLGFLPAILLVWCVCVALSPLGFSLVDIEPFDAWVFQVAGWATITVALAGLLASLFLPMAYCRFGCPTGMLLGFLRFHGASDRWTSRDWFALFLTVLAIVLWRIF